MYYTVYKTTNQINGKFYIGTHKTIDLNDAYMGSGILLKRAIQKHGLDNFKKEVLYLFDNPDEMFTKEAEIVTEDFLSEENTYNLKIGGFGGFDYINSSGKNVYGSNGANGQRALRDIIARKEVERKDYDGNPLRCTRCDSPISFEQKTFIQSKNSFCSRSCSASYNNIGRRRNPSGKNKTL